MARIRIIAGMYGGFTLDVPKGTATRPTTDRVREAWASTAASLLESGFIGAHALDVFAGSGALGLEAISRGAESVVFCENNRIALQVLKNNIKKIDRQVNAEVISQNVFSEHAIALVAAKGPYSLVILDPPYAVRPEKIINLICQLYEYGALKSGCLITYEQSNEVEKGNNFDRSNSDKMTTGSMIPQWLQSVVKKRYGNTVIDYLEFD